MLSRVADSLYWMSRYAERAEHTARVLDVQLDITLDQSPEEAGRRWRRVMQSLAQPLPEGEEADAFRILARLTFDPQNPSSIYSCISSARENARQIRELISSEMWEMLNRLYLDVFKTRQQKGWIEEPHAFFQRVKEGSHLFQGITDSTMTQGQGWHFIQAGRAVERAGSLCRLMTAHLAPTLDTDHHELDEYLEWVSTLRCCTAFEAFCKVHSAALDPATIARFLLLNKQFPHSVRFCAEELYSALNAIAEETGSRRARGMHRVAGRMRASLEFRPMEEILERGLGTFLTWIEEGLNRVNEGIYKAYIANPLRFTSEQELV